MSISIESLSVCKFRAKFECVAFTAQDRKKALSLKSHVRVISSHQPVRVSQLSEEKRSSYDSSKSQTPGRSSLESSGPAGIESSLLTDNFKELLLDPVDVQLHKLLGPDAEDYLHPTFREGAKKTLNPMVVQRKCKYACVRACSYVRILLANLRARELFGAGGKMYVLPGNRDVSCNLSPNNVALQV